MTSGSLVFTSQQLPFTALTLSQATLLNSWTLKYLPRCCLQNPCFSAPNSPLLWDLSFRCEPTTSLLIPETLSLSIIATFLIPSFRPPALTQWEINIALKAVPCVNSEVIFFRHRCDTPTRYIWFSRNFSGVLHGVCVCTHMQEGGGKEGENDPYPV